MRVVRRVGVGQTSSQQGQAADFDWGAFGGRKARCFGAFKTGILLAGLVRSVGAGGHVHLQMRINQEQQEQRGRRSARPAAAPRVMEEATKRGSPITFILNSGRSTRSSGGWERCNARPPLVTKPLGWGAASFGCAPQAKSKKGTDERVLAGGKLEGRHQQQMASDKPRASGLAFLGMGRAGADPLRSIHLESIDHGCEHYLCQNVESPALSSADDHRSRLSRTCIADAEAADPASKATSHTLAVGAFLFSCFFWGDSLLLRCKHCIFSLTTTKKRRMKGNAWIDCTTHSIL